MRPINNLRPINQQSLNLRQVPQHSIINNPIQIKLKLPSPLLNLPMIFIRPIPQTKRISLRQLRKDIFNSFIFDYELFMHFLDLAEAEAGFIRDSDCEVLDADLVDDVGLLAKG